MKRDKIRRITMAAALAASMLVGAPGFSFAQTAQSTITALSSQVGASNFADARATIQGLRNSGITAISVGDQTISLADLLAMIDAAEAGEMKPDELAAYLDALAASTAQALFLRLPGVEEYPDGYQHTEPTAPVQEPVV
jgi:hypothetical protein